MGKKIWGGFCVIAAAVYFSMCFMDIPIEGEASFPTPMFLALSIVFAIFAYFALRKPKNKNVTTNTQQDFSSIETKEKNFNGFNFSYEQAKNDLRRLDDCEVLMTTTKNLDVFFMRSELGQQIIHTLINEKHLGNNLKIYEVEETFISLEKEMKKRVLFDSFQKEKEEIAKLKTVAVQKRHWQKYLELLIKYEDRFDDYSNEYENIVQNVKENLIDTNSEFPATEHEHKCRPANEHDLISNDDVAKLIEDSYRDLIIKNAQYLNNDHSIFDDNEFTEEELLFFNSLNAELKKAKLNPNYIKATRLKFGTFNVEYITQGYVGKVAIQKRYFIQYCTDMMHHCDLHAESLQELLDTIPKWIDYINYMKRH